MFIINAQKIKGNTSKGMRDYIEEKLNFLEGDVKVIVEKEGQLIKVSSSFTDKFNHHYYISTKRPDFYEAVDRLKDKCKREIKEYNKKVVANKVVDYDFEDDNLELIAKEKTLICDEISIEKAIEEMENLGHNWFVFRDEDTSEFAIVYKRYKDGYGLMRIK